MEEITKAIKEYDTYEDSSEIQLIVSRLFAEYTQNRSLRQ